MLNFFRSKTEKNTNGITPGGVTFVNGETMIDVSGQTCPGYLLSVNKAVSVLEKGSRICVMSTYPPCGEDVKSYCNQKGFEYSSVNIEDGIWKIRFIK